MSSTRFLIHTVVLRALVFIAFTGTLAAQVAQPIPGRYLISYRNATIPGDAEQAVAASGARLTQRHEQLGIASVAAEGSVDAEHERAVMRRLAQQPGVLAVVHDRVVTAHTLILAPLSPQADATAFLPWAQSQIRRPLPAPVPESLLPPALSARPVAPIPSPNAPVPAAPVPAPGLLGPTLPPITSGGPLPVPIFTTPLPTPQPPALTLKPFDTFYASPEGWAVRQVGGFGAGTLGGPARGPWDITKGRGVRIAILDSGVDATHPDLAPNLVLNLSEIDQSAQTGLPSPCDTGSPQDQQGHGSWTASLAAGAAGPGTGDVIGVAPQASILNIKVIERMPNAVGDCTSGQAAGLLSWVIQGINDAVANHADIISLSLGSLIDLSSSEATGLKLLFDQTTFAASQSGTLIIAAVGNDAYNLSGPRFIELPAQARSVLAIAAATNPACAENLLSGAVCAPGPITRPYYSSYGAAGELSAPGGSYPAGPVDGISGWVRGACSSGIPNTADGAPSDLNHSFGCFNLGHTAYVQAMGTSAAAPLAAGAAALIHAAYPNLSMAQVGAALRSSAQVSATLAIPQVDAAQAIAP